MIADIIERLKYIAEGPTLEHGGYHSEDIATAKDAIAEIERLRAALRPFAHQAKIIDDPANVAQFGGNQDFVSFYFQGSITAISLGDCRNARKVLDDVAKAKE